MSAYDVVLCRGVLNDLISDSDREVIFRQLAARLREGGMLIFDVRDWERSAITKRTDPIFQKLIRTEQGDLNFVSVIELNPERHELLIVETMTLTGASGVQTVKCNVIMRCWTLDELSHGLQRAGFTKTNYLGDHCDSVDVGTTDRIIAVAQLG